MLAIVGNKPALTAAAMLPAVASAVAAEWRAIRREAGHVAELPALDADTVVGGDALPADSLDLLRLAGAVGQQFGLAELGIDDYLLRRRSLGQWAELAAHALNQAGASVHFATSGSTGTPRTVRHPMALLWREARWLVEALPDCRRIYTVAPAHHIYGFIFGVLLPAAKARPAVHAMGVSEWRPDELADGDLVVGFPAFWRYLADSERALPAGAIGVSSTAPLSVGVAQRLNANGLGRLLEVFGSSETAGLGLRETAGAPFRLMDHWRFTADDRLEQLDENGAWQPHPGPDDRLERLDERHFRPLGRRDGAVQVGGVNVFPADVARRLTEHPAVTECHVRPTCGDEHARLKAFIVPAETDADPAALRAELERWCREAFSTAERPVSFTFGAALPRNTMGKLQDW